MPTEPDASQPDRPSRRRLAEDDFGMLAEWLARPHVHRWWHHETSTSAVMRDFGPAARGEEAAEDLLVSLDDDPFAVVQRSRLGDYPDYHAELQEAVDVPSEAVTIGYFISLEKAGLTRVGEGDLPPDNPADPPLHYIYRADRPV